MLLDEPCPLQKDYICNENTEEKKYWSTRWVSVALVKQMTSRIQLVLQKAE